MNYCYEELISGINSGTISGFYFQINGYAHYKKCSLFRVNDRIMNGKSITRIEARLVEDGTEIYSFYKTFQDDFKLFNMKRKGKFTLKQMWNNVTILEVVNSSSQ